MLRSVLGALAVASLGLILLPGIGEAWIAAMVIGAAVFGFAKKGGAVDGLRELDDVLYQGERLIVAISLLVMAFVVFVDVVWRTAHAFEGARAYGTLGAILGLCLLGGYTARWEGASAGKRLGAGLAAFVVFLGLGAAIYAAPNGFGWSQKLALVLIIWVGLLGGSMATREGRHIAVDAVKRVIPERFARGFAVAAGATTVVLSVVLAVLGAMYARGNYVDWVETGFRAYVFDSFPVPFWAATVSIPIGFGLMAARFLAVTIFGAKEVDLLTSVGAGGSDEEEEAPT